MKQKSNKEFTGRFKNRCTIIPVQLHLVKTVFISKIKLSIPFHWSLLPYNWVVLLFLSELQWTWSEACDIKLLTWSVPPEKHNLLSWWWQTRKQVNFQLLHLTWTRNLQQRHYFGDSRKPSVVFRILPECKQFWRCLCEEYFKRKLSRSLPDTQNWVNNERQIFPPFLLSLRLDQNEMSTTSSRF